MADVLFKKGLQASYDGMATKVATTFYYTTDKKNLYIGDVLLSNGADVEAAVSRITTNEKDIAALKELTAKLDGDDTVEGSVKKQIKDAVAASEAKLAAVATSGKAADVTVEDADGKYTAENVEGVLGEIATKIENNATAGEVTLTTATSEEATAAGYAAVYTINQGGKEVGKINIAKDMVATKGEIVNADADGNAGTFIKLTIANNDTPVYINVASLIEYNAVSNAEGAEVTLAESEDHAISATLAHVAGSKIDDGTVAKAKLDTSVQASLDKADSALQAADKTELAAATKKAQDAADAAQADVDALETVVGKAADTEAGTAATGIFKKIDDAVAAQDSKNSTQDSDIATLKAAVGEGGSVDDKIANAVNALDVTDVATAVVDAEDATKVGIYGVKETDGVIAQGAKIADVDAFGTAAKVQSDITGTDDDAATTDTLKGHRAAITALEDKVGTESVDDKIKKLDGSAVIAAVDAEDATKINLYDVTETDGVISQGATTLAADKAGTAAAVKTALEGNADTAKAEDTTINGAKKYADSKLEAALTWQEF